MDGVLILFDVLDSILWLCGAFGKRRPGEKDPIILLSLRKTLTSAQ